MLNLRRVKIIPLDTTEVEIPKMWKLLLAIQQMPPQFKEEQMM